MKSSIWMLLLGLVSCLFLQAGSAAEILGKMAAGGVTAVMPTGYPEEEVQRECVFLDGRLYVYTGNYLSEAPQDVREIGMIEQVDNQNYPTKDWAASQLELGMKIWKGQSDEVIYIEVGSGRFEKFMAESIVVE